MLAPWKKSYDHPRQHIKTRDITLPTKVHLVKAMVFLVVMYGCESRTIKKAERWRIDAFELCVGKDSWKSLGQQPVNPKGNQSWIIIGRTDTEAEAPIHWPPDAKSQVIGKDADAEKDWRQEKVTTLNKMVEWHHWLNEHKFQHALGDAEGQGGLAHCSGWGLKSQTWFSNWRNL